MSEETEISSKDKSASQKRAKKTAGKGSSVALFNKEIEIYLSEELPEFSNVYAKAYRAFNLSDSMECIAYLCDKTYTPRSRSSGAFFSIVNTSLVHLIASGVVYVPAFESQKYTFVYQNNMDSRIVPLGQDPYLGWKSEDALEKIVFPLVDVLLDMRNKDLVHGAIHPKNLFAGGSEQDASTIILGDCLAAPAFSTLPTVCETIERAWANPISRGVGNHGNDLYSLGVTAGLLMHSKDPFNGKTGSEIIEHKLKEGSFASVIGSERITGPIVEFLRGVLNDDPRERWGIEEAIAWKDGRRLSPKQGSMRKKASRPIKFNDGSYSTPNLLALHLNDSVQEALQLIEGGDLEQWLFRSLEDKVAVETLNQAVSHARQAGRGAGYGERLVCRTILALESNAPVQYKSVSALPEGIGSALTEAFIKGQGLRDFSDIFNQEVFSFWASNEPDTVFDVGAIVNRFQACRGYLRQETIGYGLERCLYYLNPEAPCLSFILKDYYVRSPEDMLHAFEEIAIKEKPRYLLDRHIVAFLSLKERRLVDEHLLGLNSVEKSRQTLATLQVFASIQRKSKLPKLPNLTSLMAENLKPVYSLYHNRDLRKKMEDEIQNARKKGDLSMMALALNDPEVLKMDMQMFLSALNRYQGLQKEKMALDKGLLTPNSFGRTSGQEVAAFTAFVLATIMVLGFALITLGGTGANFLPG